MIKNKLHLYKFQFFNDETVRNWSDERRREREKHRKEINVNRCYSGVKSYRNYYLTKMIINVIEAKSLSS